MGCKSISISLGCSSKGFLDFNIHWKNVQLLLTATLSSLYRKGQAAEPSAQGLHEEGFHRVFTHHLPLKHNRTLPGCAKPSPETTPWSSWPPNSANSLAVPTRAQTEWQPIHHLPPALEAATPFHLLSGILQQSTERCMPGMECWGRICTTWRGNCPETVGCLYQTFLYNELWLLWTSLCFSTHGFRAVSTQQDPLLTVLLHDRLSVFLCLR